MSAERPADPPRKTGRLRPALALAVSILLLLSTALFVYGRLTLPSDGTVVNAEASLGGGWTIRVRQTAPDGLQEDDVVLAIDGRPLDEWLRLARQRPFAAAAPAAEREYLVLRGGVEQRVRQPLDAFPLGAFLRQQWSGLIFLYYMLGVGLLVFARKPRLPAAQALLVAASALTSSGTIYFLGMQASDVAYGWMTGLWLWGSTLLYVIMTGATVQFSLMFPRERPWLRQRPWLSIVVYLGMALPAVLSFVLGLPGAASASAQMTLLLRATNWVTVFFAPLILAAVVLAYRIAANETERRQVRWVLWAGLVSNVPWLVLVAVPVALGQPPLISQLVLGLFWCTVPTALAIAILREHLFDIDVIINRSLVYGGLTVTLAVVYFALVVLLQSVFTRLTGESRSEFVTVLSTLTIAALAAPLRRRLQDLIDRRFYRRKYDAARILAAFAATLRDDVDLNQLGERLVGVVADVMEPAHVSLWLKPQDESKRK